MGTTLKRKRIKLLYEWGEKSELEDSLQERGEKEAEDESQEVGQGQIRKACVQVTESGFTLRTLGAQGSDGFCITHLRYFLTPRPSTL